MIVRDTDSGIYLMINKMLKDLNYKKYLYEEGTAVRKQIDISIKEMSILKDILSKQINDKSRK
tara:strand:- start:2520 stop:2708 length:189 start_codon:yes stop_codon:yes gene_type:complete